MVNTIFLLEKSESSEEEWVNKTIVNEEKHEKKYPASRNEMEVTLHLNSSEAKMFPW